MNEYKLIKFKDSEFELDVNVSPEEDTVWLTKDEIAKLFERDKSVVSRHISNIYKEKELDKNRTVAKNAQVQIEGSRKVKRIIELYNLDVIISVGYRVKSKRGILFRKWANNVLKQYLLKGYILDENRIIISKSNYIQLENDVKELKDEVADIKEKVFIEPTKERLIFNGQFYDAYDFISSLIESANKSILIIDPYFDKSALRFLTKAKCDVEIEIYLSSKAKLESNDIEEFEKQYNHVEIITNDLFHDRFLILDEKSIYLIGTSLNSIGKKTFAIHTLEDKDIINNLLERIKEIS